MLFLSNFGRVNRHFLKPNLMLKLLYHGNYCIDFIQILQNDKHQRVLLMFVGGHNAHPVNPRWRMAAILKKSVNCEVSAMV